MSFVPHQWEPLGDTPKYGYHCVNCNAAADNPHFGACSGRDGASALQKQVGGDHYKKLAIQPVEYITKNKIPYLEGNVIKYVTRWRDKGGVADLEKAKHYIDLILQFEKGE